MLGRLTVAGRFMPKMRFLYFSIELPESILTLKGQNDVTNAFSAVMFIVMFWDPPGVIKTYIRLGDIIAYLSRIQVGSGMSYTDCRVRATSSLSQRDCKVQVGSDMPWSDCRVQVVSGLLCNQLMASPSSHTHTLLVTHLQVLDSNRMPPCDATH